MPGSFIYKNKTKLLFDKRNQLSIPIGMLPLIL